MAHSYHKHRVCFPLSRLKHDDKACRNIFFYAAMSAKHVLSLKYKFELVGRATFFKGETQEMAQAIGKHTPTEKLCVRHYLQKCFISHFFSTKLINCSTLNTLTISSLFPIKVKHTVHSATMHVNMLNKCLTKLVKRECHVLSILLSPS